LEELGVKALLIGVAIFVTLLITSIVMLEFFQIGEIYKHVGEVNPSFEERFDKLDKFRNVNNVFTGLDVKNYINKYKNDNNIKVCLDNGTCDDPNNIPYNEEYSPGLESTGNKYIITFTKK